MNRMKNGKTVEAALKEIGIITHDPMKIMYKYVSADTAIKIITSGLLLYQSPQNFNDPYDAHFGMVDLKDTAKKLFLKTFQEIMGATPSESDYVEWQDSLNNTVVSSIQTMRSRMGIFCGSMTNSHLLLWGHYGDKHKGVCLGFKGLGADISGVSAAIVRYVDKIEPMAFALDMSPEDIFALVSMVCTKAKCWSYEEEVRVMKFEQNGLLPFEKSNLCEIYFGADSVETHVTSISNLLLREGYNTKMYKMEMLTNEFKLIPKQLSV